MKKYKKPLVEIVKFNNMDIITMSGTNDSNDAGNETDATLTPTPTDTPQDVPSGIGSGPGPVYNPLINTEEYTAEPENTSAEDTDDTDDDGGTFEQPPEEKEDESPEVSEQVEIPESPQMEYSEPEAFDTVSEDIGEEFAD